MKPDLIDVKHVAFRKFGKDARDVPIVTHWANGGVAAGKAWEHITKHLNDIDTTPGAWPSLHTELSLKLEHDKCAYVIAFDSGIQTAFGPGPSPITLLPPGLNGTLLDNVGLIYAAGTSDVDFVAASDIPADFGAMPTGGALIFTCKRKTLEKVWNDATPKGHAVTPMALPFALNLYDTTSQQPIWVRPLQVHASAAGNLAAANVETHGGIHPGTHNHIGGGEAEGSANNVETHGGIHPGIKLAIGGSGLVITHGGGGTGVILTHGGIHPSSNSQVLY